MVVGEDEDVDISRSSFAMQMLVLFKRRISVSLWGLFRLSKCDFRESFPKKR